MNYSLRLILFLLTLASLLSAGPAPIFANGALIPVPARTDMVFDHAGKYLYITTFEGFVERYNLATGQLDSAYNIGGSLYGFDISTDDSFLILAQGNAGLIQGVFQRLALDTGTVTNINYELVGSETGGWDVAIASNNLAFVTTQVPPLASDWTPLRQIDLATNEITARTDAPGSNGSQVRHNSIIYRSADRNRLYFLESDISNGPAFTYDATTDTFGPSVETHIFLEVIDAAVNRDGTLLGTGLYTTGMSLDSAPTFNFIHNFTALNTGLAFDAVKDVLYGGDLFTSEIIGYNTNTFAETMRTPIGEAVDRFRYDRISTLVASQDGRYLALATLSGVRLIPTASSGTANLANISTRLDVQAGDNVLIGGFIIDGTQAKTVAVRGIGPSLGGSGIVNPLQNPVLELHQGSAIIATNDDWQTASNADSVPEELRPTDSRESVILTTLQPGSYTAIVSGAGNNTGVGLVEVYDLDSSVDSRLANVSTRGFVQTGDDVMIGGVIAQNGDGIAQIVVRAIGPSLKAAGIPNALLDPVLELHGGNGELVATNDNWKDTQEAAIEATGLAPSNDLESAILTTVTAGAYTAIVRGSNNASGIGLVEVYNLN